MFGSAEHRLVISLHTELKTNPRFVYFLQSVMKNMISKLYGELFIEQQTLLMPFPFMCYLLLGKCLRVTTENQVVLI